MKVKEKSPWVKKGREDKALDKIAATGLMKGKVKMFKIK